MEIRIVTIYGCNSNGTIVDSRPPVDYSVDYSNPDSMGKSTMSTLKKIFAFHRDARRASCALPLTCGELCGDSRLAPKSTLTPRHARGIMVEPC